ncbi:hypothetical protein [Nocardia asteroides]
MTSVQLGIVAGIATIGSIFFALAETDPGRALTVVHLLVGAISLVAAALAALAVQRTRP